MTVAKAIAEKLSLRKALLLTGISNTKWHHSETPRNIPLNKIVTEIVQTIGSTRPTYGTRRMAAAASRELGKAVNRKQIRRIFRRLAWIEPSKSKKQIIKVSRKLFKPTVPSQLWRQTCHMWIVEMMVGVIVSM